MMVVRMRGASVSVGAQWVPFGIHQPSGAATLVRGGAQQRCSAHRGDANQTRPLHTAAAANSGM